MISCSRCTIFSKRNLLSPEVYNLLRSQPLTRSILIAFCTLLLICVAGVGLVRVSSERAVSASGKISRFNIAWSRQVGSIEDIHFAPDTGSFSLIFPNGKIQCCKKDGSVRYSCHVPYADRVVLSRGGNFALAYSRQDLVHNTLTFLNRSGEEHWRMDVSGAVWCADVYTTEDGACFVVGTGNCYIYVINIGPRERNYRRWRVPGAVISAAFDSRGESIYYGTWQNSVVGRATLRGRRIWQVDAQNSCLQRVESLHSRSRIFVRSLPNCSISDGDFCVMNKDGDEIWSRTLSCYEATSVLPSANGLYVGLGYKRKIVHKGKSVYEKHVVLYDAVGREIWDKGSLFLQIKPVAVTSTGCTLVIDNENMLFAVGVSGDLDPFVKLSAPILHSYMSDDGSHLLLHCADGKLYMLRIS